MFYLLYMITKVILESSRLNKSNDVQKGAFVNKIVIDINRISFNQNDDPVF